MSLKKRSSKKSSSKSIKNISITRSGKVKNSPIKSMNGLSMKELIKNDKKIDTNLMSDLKKLILLSEQSKEIKETKVDSKYFCNYLKTNLTREKMKTLFHVLMLSKEYSDNKTMEHLCEDLRKYRPDLMRHRILNFLTLVMNTVFNKKAIIIFLIATGLMAILLSNMDLSNRLIPVSRIREEFYLKNKGRIVGHRKISEEDSFIFKYILKQNPAMAERIKKDYIVNESLSIAYNSWIYFQMIRLGSYFFPSEYRSSLVKQVRERHTARDILENS